MKIQLTVILAIVLIVDLALFFGIGFGSQSLAVVPTTANSTTVTSGYSSNPWNVDNAFSFQVNVTSWTQGGTIPTTGLSNGAQSNSISFTVAVWSDDGPGCASTVQNPVWAPGVGASWGAIVIQFGQPFTIVNGGNTYVSSGGSFVWSLNSTKFIAYCINKTPNAVGQNQYSGVSNTLNHNVQTTFWNTAFTFLNQPNEIYTSSVLYVSLVGQGPTCSYNQYGSYSGSACNAIGTVPDTAGEPCGCNFQPAGTWQVAQTAQINTYSGYAYIQDTNAGQLTYNGGTITAQATTGYGGPSGYTAYVAYPPARPSGNQVDAQFQQIPVANFCVLPCQFSWPVPSGASQNNSNPQWNDFTLVLVSANGYVQGQSTVGIDINPTYAPGLPSVTLSNTGKFTGPQVGDTEKISVSANPQGQSSNVTAITIWAYFNPGNNPPSAQPPCGQYWISACTGLVVNAANPGGSGGIACSFGTSGGSASAACTFVVSPPPGGTQIIVQAQAANGNAQVSAMATATVNIVPTNCNYGIPGCPPSGQSYWTWLGPLLLSIAIVLSAILAAFYLPAYPRILVIVAGVAVVVLGYVWLWSILFAPGGFLAPGLV